jgi:hypothetical protein
MKQLWSGVLLDQLQEKLSLDATQHDRLLAGTQSPWWLSALLGLAAWLASIPFIVTLLGPWFVLVDDIPGRAVAGVMLIVLALWMFRRQQVFASQVGLVLSLTGQGMLIFLLGEYLDTELDSWRPLAVFSLLVSGILLWLPSSFLHRHLCALLTLISLAVLIGTGIGFAIYCVALAVITCMLWLQRRHWVNHPYSAQIRALTDAGTLISLIMVMLAHEDMLDQSLELNLPEAAQWMHLVYPLGMGGLLVGVVAWLVRSALGASYWLALGAAVLLAVLASPAPGFLLTLSLGLAVFQASNRSWLILMPAFATFYLFVLYYSLHISLLDKSLLMIASGTFLLVCGWWMSRYSEALT